MLGRLRTGEQVIETDLSGAAERWPRFVPLADELDLGSVHPFPLRLRDTVLGALNVFFPEAGAFSETDVRTLQALDGRVVIEQAKGILVGEGEDLTAAFERMRAVSRDRNLRIRDVARHVVEHRRLPDS